MKSDAFAQFLNDFVFSNAFFFETLYFFFETFGEIVGQIEVSGIKHSLFQQNAVVTFHQIFILIVV